MIEWFKKLFVKSETRPPTDEPQKVVDGISEIDIDTAVRTMYGECRGESALGQRAVAHVIINRWKKPCWWSKPDHTIQSVCLAPYQFSCWLKSDPNRVKMLALSKDDPTYLKLKMNFLQALREEDVTKGATHYYAKYIPAPKWVATATKTFEEGVHLFYKDVK